MKKLIIFLTLTVILITGCATNFTKAKAHAMAEKVCKSKENVYKVKFTIASDTIIYCKNGKSEFIPYSKISDYTSNTVKQYLKETK